MIRTASLRFAAQLPVARQTTARRSQPALHAARPIAYPRSSLSLARAYADAAAPPPPPPSQAAASGGGGGGGGGGGSAMWIVLGAIVALGGAGYWFLKPVRDVASVTHQAVSSVKDGAGNYADALSGMAKTVLPPGAFAIYSHLANQEGGINGFLHNLQGRDLEGALEEIKKYGGDDVKRIVDKVEKKVKDAKGKVQDVDWRGLAEELKKELPEGSQKTVDMLIGQIPTKEDYEQFVNKLKEAGQQRKKEIEAAASKVMQQVEKAKKEGKGSADAYLKGLKEAAPADVDSLIKQVKDTAKSAGLPADQIESWLKTKMDDGKVDAEALAKQLESKLKTASKFLPGEPKDLVAQVKQFSPSLADLLAQALQQADIVDEKLNRKK